MGIEELDNGKLKKIYIVPHSHHDYAWVHERQWHIWRYIRIFSDVVEWLDKNPKATWMIDNVIHSLIPFLENAPKAAEKFKKYVAEGRIEITNGGYSLARPSYVGEETFVRNLVAGDRFFKSHFQVSEIPMYHNFDVSCGQQQLPQILALAGFKYYRFYRPELTLDHRQIPRSFYWEGLDGTRILVHRGFCPGLMSAAYTNMDFETQWNDIRTFFYHEELSHRRPKDVFHADIEYLNFGVDDSLPPINRSKTENPIRIDEFVEEWNKRETVEMAYSSSTAFFEDLAAKDLPVVKGGLDDSELTFNFPCKGEKSMWRLRLELDRRLVRLEGICSMAAMLGIAYPEDKISELWYQLFEITGHAIEFIHQRDDDALMDVAVNAKTRANIMIKEYLDKITSTVAYTEGMKEIAVNTLPFEREEAVSLYIAGDGRLKGFDLFDAEGNKLDYQVIQQNSYDELFDPSEGQAFTSVDVVAKIKVPAFGYQTIIAKSNGERTPKEAVKATMIDTREQNLKNAPDRLVIDNGVIQVALTRGKIVSVKNLKTGKTVCSAFDSPLMTLRCVINPPYTDWLSDNSSVSTEYFAPSSWKLIENGPIRWRYRVNGSFIPGQKATLDLIFTQGSPVIDFDLVLDTQPIDCYYTADFRSDMGCKTYGDVFYGVEARKAEDIIKENLEVTVDGQIYGRNFVTFETATMPVALVSNNCSIYYLHDQTENYMSILLVRNCVFDNAKDPWIRDMSPAYAMSGKNSFKYALFFSGETGCFSDIQRFVKEYHHPVQIGMKNNKNDLGEALKQSLLSLQDGSLIPTAIYFEQDYCIIRVFETDGKPANLLLKAAGEIESAQAIDLLGNPINDVALIVDSIENTVSANVEPFKIVTLKLKLKK